jgi:two-component sensor histidine kinase
LAVHRLKTEISQKVCLTFCLGLAYLSNLSPVAAAPTSIEVTVDGITIENTGATIKIPSSAKDILFQVGDADQAGDPRAGRVRYRLEGIDADWLSGHDAMSFNIYFYDRSGDQIRGKIYEVKGLSSGWNDSVEKSTFTHRRETFSVPPGADSLGVIISSAGPPTSVGIYVVEDVLVTRSPHEGSAPETLLDSRPFSRLGNNANRDMPEWTAEGIRPSMAKLINLHDPQYSGQAFCIIDDDKTAHAEWRSGRENAPKVIPGEYLTAEWNEMYDTGKGNRSLIHYGPLPAGHYRFKVQEVDVWDHPLNSENSIDLWVPAPYWENPWFWAGCTGIVAALLTLGARYWIRMNIRRQLLHMRLIEQERLRIARDLHDDLGARLAHISLTSANAESESSFPAALARIQKISSMTRELASSLSEVVWMVNPENDHLESLVSFLCRLIHGLCEPASIRCRIDALGMTDERPAPSALRHHVSLAVKEAVNNVLKHSGATELRASIQFEAPRLKISISDNGKGFEPGRTQEGNGLANMRHRMSAVEGKFAIESTEGKGTTVYFEVPIP